MSIEFRDTDILARRRPGRHARGVSWNPGSFAAALMAAQNLRSSKSFLFCVDMM